VKLGLVLEASPGRATLASLAQQAVACETAGIDLVWLGPAGDGAGRVTTTLAAAAALAAVTTALRLAAAVQVGSHPLRIAEEATVADNCANGRLVLVLVDRQAREDLLAESADVLLAATAPRPFSHDGPRWKIPAHRPENDDVERRLRVTPASAQIELPIWLGGGACARVARQRGLSHVCTRQDTPAAAAEVWAATDAHLGMAAARLRRPAIRSLDVSPEGHFDDEGLVARLRAEREQWGMDVAIVHLPGLLDDHARERVIDAVARLVRPRVQLDALPAGLEEHWKETFAKTDDKELGT
jgi:alkanesulfonate monooxygenase SsuD/methylene tetrahydromethanopterin reductase-like flavin-dependent oxidoreductase (luciferase family)